MNFQRPGFLLVIILAGAVAAPAWAQSAAPLAGPAGSGTQSAAFIPDFSGTWAHPSLGFENPISGPGPVRNRSRTPSGASNFNLLVGDYTNPILRPHAAEAVKKNGEISLSGKVFPDPDKQCLQGNRISKLSDKLGQICVIPACELELSTQGRLGVVLSHDVESHVAQDGEIVGSVVEAISGLILIHNDVEAPMESIFDAPMGTHDIGEALGGQGCAEKVIGCLGRGLGGEFTDADDFADGRQSGPLMPLLEPSDIGRDEGGAGFDPTVIAIDRLIGGGGCSLKLWVVEELFDIGMQRALVAFERQGVIALLIDDLLGDVALAVEGINRYGAAFQR